MAQGSFLTLLGVSQFSHFKRSGTKSVNHRVEGDWLAPSDGNAREKVVRTVSAGIYKEGLYAK